MEGKFRLEVQKGKCTTCDLIFLVENSEEYEVDITDRDCPNCGTNHFVESMGIITVVEEEGE